MEENFTPDTFLLQVDTGNIPYLTETAKWAKFLAIVGFVICALLLLVAIFYGSVFTGSFSELDTETTIDADLQSIFVIIYVAVIIVLYFFPLLYLYNFSSKLQAAIRHNDQISLNASFRNLKSCFKYLGILTIIVLCVYAIGITFAMLGLAFMN